MVSTDKILVHNSCLPKNHLDEGLRRQGFNVGGVYPAGFKQKWTNGGFEYEARIHPADPAYGQTGNIYRVARRRLGTDANGQGDGWEYIDINGNWHHTSTLKPNNPTYNAQAARDTHIPIPNSNIE